MAHVACCPRGPGGRFDGIYISLIGGKHARLRLVKENAVNTPGLRPSRISLHILGDVGRRTLAIAGIDVA